MRSIRVTSKSPDVFELISDNRRYSPIEISSSDLKGNRAQVIGRVVWIFKRI